MTKKKKRGIIWLLVVIVILGIGYIALKSLNERAEETELSEAETDVIEIISLDTEAIESFSYYDTDEEAEPTLLVFEKEADTWICTNAETESDEEEAELDQTIIQTMLSNTAPLNAVRLVSESPEDLSEYGLDEPQNTITFADGDGNETTLLIGMQNSTTGDYYLQDKDSGAVYTVSSAFPAAFDYSLEELIAEEAEDSDTDSDEDTDE